MKCGAHFFQSRIFEPQKLNSQNLGLGPNFYDPKTKAQKNTGKVEKKGHFSQKMRLVSDFLRISLQRHFLSKNDIFFAIFSMSSIATPKPFRGCKETANVVLLHPRSSC